MLGTAVWSCMQEHGSAKLSAMLGRAMRSCASIDGTLPSESAQSLPRLSWDVAGKEPLLLLDTHGSPSLPTQM